MPTYLPPPPPTPYVAPYTVPDGVPPSLRAAANSANAAPAAYAQQSAETSATQNGDASQSSPGYAPAQIPSDYTSSPWPLSPAARAAQDAVAAPTLPGADANANEAAASNTAKKKAQAQRNRVATARTAPVYPSNQAPAPQGTAAYGQTGYPPNTYPAPANAAYYAQQPYIPQPPPGYGQAYVGAAPNDSAAVASPAYGTATAAPNQQTLGVADELAQINREQSSTVTGGLVFRNRTGESGLSNVTDIEAPVEGRIAAGNGHIVVTATPVTLDAGTASNQVQTLARFGSGGTAVSSQSALTTGNNTYGSQTANGVGLSVGYDSNNLKGDVGTTPLGFREENVVGGLEYDGAVTDKVSYSLAVARRAVTDSLLSYAGATDAGAKLTWGGVTSNGARLGLTWDDGTNGFYLSGEYQYYEGTQVESNTAGKGGGGVYTRVVHSADQSVTVGVNATVEGYAKNLSYFTYGQGGYFSPQQYVLLNLPVEWTGRDGPVTYDLKGSIGVQHYREDSSDYFPTNPALQASAAGSPNVPDAGGVYPGQSKTGISYAFSAVGEYQLAPQLAVGALASLGNAYQYREWIAAFYVRYSFTKQSGLQTFPPSALTSPYLSLSN